MIAKIAKIGIPIILVIGLLVTIYLYRGHIALFFLFRDKFTVKRKNRGDFTSAIYRPRFGRVMCPRGYEDVGGQGNTQCKRRNKSVKGYGIEWN